MKNRVLVFTSLLCLFTLSHIKNLNAGIASDPSTLIPSDGLVAYYPLDNDGLDKSKNKNDAVHFSAQPTENRHGQKGKALKFDGDSDYVEIESKDYLSIADKGVLTISIWMRPDVENYTKAQGSVPCVHWFGKGEGGKQEYVSRIYNKDTRNGDRISFYAYNLSGGLGDGTGIVEPYAIGEWMHFVIIYDYIRNTIDFYKDGAFIKSGNFTQFGVIAEKGNAPLRLGTRDFASFFAGGIDDLRVYNRALSPEEVVALYKE